jgi:hypothetical protein
MRPGWDGKGAVVTWPIQWASETLGRSRICFEGLKPHDRVLVPKDEKHDSHFEWTVTLPPEYPVKSRDTANVVKSKTAQGVRRLTALSTAEVFAALLAVVLTPVRQHGRRAAHAAEFREQREQAPQCGSP